MKNKLAIIIPAYKACFFREVLDSIVRQSNRDFTVYIGDDASPDDLESIVSDYKDKFVGGTYTLNTAMTPTEMMKVLSCADTGEDK